MVRTAEYLYRWTGEARYADYIERALYNGFLAQQNRATGMPTYFLPMHAGSRKKWGSRTRDFWCCFGTMVQAQTIYPRLIWYTEENGITVSQYIPSEMETEAAGGTVRVTQQIHMKNYNNQVLFDEHSGGRVTRWSLMFRICSETDTPWSLKLRVPSWCAGKPVLALNGKELPEVEIRDGYIRIRRTWSEDELEVFFPSEVRFEPVEGAEELVCAVDGPIVLAGLTEKDAGIAGDLEHPEKILIPEMTHTYETFVWTQNNYITRNQKENFRMIPLYDVTDEAYTLYFTRTESMDRGV